MANKHFINCYVSFVWLLCVILLSTTTVGDYTSNYNCSSAEREALISFKQGLSDPSARLSSWVGHNCCQWHGITCDLISGNVIKIDLHNSLGSTISPSSLRFGGDYEQPWKDPEDFVQDFQKTSLSGKISSSLLDLKHLNYIDLSLNNFEGAPIPYFFGMLTSVRLESMLVVDLANNNLHGKIPTTIGLSTSLNILKLENNNLHGEIPESLQNCSLLTSIDLSENRFLNGDLPSWIGVALSKLRLLNLRFNNFSGTIPRQWCNLHFLRILDLSNNRLFGEVPSCLYNWTSFVHGDEDLGGLGYYQYSTGLRYYSYEENTMLVMKCTESKYYNAIVKLVLTIDLSMNKLSGEIPNEITKLIHLCALNLSWNALVGTIPENIGAMKTLETLDLSQNHLSGRIPDSLASLNFLTHLNMSFNNLTGKIPTGNQIQTLEDPSIYEGNPSLCGPPLKIKCPGDENSNNTPISTRDEEDGKENDSEMLLGFYISVAIGFPVGLNILFFIIFTNEARRIFYFRFIDRVNYNILQTIDSLTIGLRRMIMWRRSY
ncbi:hypothetical protein IC575_029446 [Cucumis melo]